ncbi:MAG: hypothetical protein ACI97P_000662 [Arcticibacterium sp.]|jgi:hypothetical protein
MHKGEISSMLIALNEEIYTFLGQLCSVEQSENIDGKWSVSQNIDHLCKVLVPVNKALSKPKFLLRFAFGKPNREGRNYEALVKRYLEKAQGPAKAPEVYRAKENKHLSPQILWDHYQALSQKLLKIIDRKWSEKQLDSYLVVHPLLGKITIRELLYFVHFHSDHHFTAIKLVLDQKIS